ncbi:hypothetical protein N646_1270 [Vibrio alginolyticus NBRC 15630 = ATCC 17749]|uniref:Uncharacterized protein n=1 Tax=Vibrio alginolyticus (strain ATCC 17749 / DSM 2171 / NBRC 15630 / NCIMB 1903 / NCTC 12160 / XII-53) TaxID=1219076 RepID=A0A2I3C7Y8_VIBAX|nr:hypothetical protein N646_1270 [Vibrio alginolyticus NBRC 15630 = ATCC 17749]
MGFLLSKLTNVTERLIFSAKPNKNDNLVKLLLPTQNLHKSLL